MSVMEISAVNDPIWSPIEIRTDDGKSVVFHRGSTKQLAQLTPEELVETADMLAESRRGTCWASHPKYDGSVRAFQKFCTNNGVGVFVR